MIGEIWCAILMHMGRTTGTNLALQVTVDALKLCPANPSFLDMRDATLRAVEYEQQAGRITREQQSAAVKGCWATFAKFGMGPNARSDGPALSGIVADFQVPPDNVDSPPPASNPAPVSGPGTTPPIGQPPQSNLSNGMEAEARPDIAIPDKDPVGISSTITITIPGNIRSLDVSVDITHPFVGDLRITLFGPDGTSFLLQDQLGFNAVNLQRTFTTDDVSALKALLGRPAAGVWRLTVADLVRLSVGKLTAWKLRVSIQ